MKRKLNYNKIEFGFTMVEILIVLVIIGMLASIFAVASPSPQRKSRDVTRKNDLRQYQTAILKYFNENGIYPVRESSAVITELCSLLSLNDCPDDPKVAEGTHYQYQSDAAGTQYALWTGLEDEENNWVACSGGLAGISSTIPSGGNCPIEGATPPPTPPPTPEPTDTPQPTATPTDSPTAPPSTPTPTPSNGPGYWVGITEGETVSNNIRVGYEIDKSLTNNVTFYIDGDYINKENLYRYCLEGGDSYPCDPHNIDSLSGGNHQISVVISLKSGGTANDSINFNIGGEAGGPGDFYGITDGQTVGSSIRVGYEIDKSLVDYINFYVDGDYVNREGVYEYCLESGNGPCDRYYTSSLGSGMHTISVQVRMKSGQTETDQINFYK